MKIIEILIISAITLTIYSAIACVIFEITRENESVGIYFGLGIVGLVLISVAKTIKWIKKQKTRSIFKCQDGDTRRCKVVESEYVEYLDDYKIIMRYANPIQWRHLKKIDRSAVSEGKLLYDEDYAEN